MENLSCVLMKAGVLEVKNMPISDPGQDYVQVAIHTNGICASDVHKWENGGLGMWEITKPLVLGHEASGVVVKIGPGVTNVKVGDRVALETGIGCHYCLLCKKGRYNICDNWLCPSLPGFHGTLANYSNHPARYCHLLADNVSMEEGALVEPLSVVLHACRRAKVSLGDRVLITGAGTIGTMAILACKAIGASQIIVTDINQDKLEFAKKMGATAAILATKHQAEIVREIKAICEIDVTLECCGVHVCTDLAIAVTKPGGTVCQIGLAQGMTDLSVGTILAKELNVIGSMAYMDCYPLAIDMLSRGMIDVKPMITHTYQLEDAPKAFQRAQTGEGNPVKIIVLSEKCKT